MPASPIFNQISEARGTNLGSITLNAQQGAELSTRHTRLLVNCILKNVLMLFMFFKTVNPSSSLDVSGHPVVPDVHSIERCSTFMASGGDMKKEQHLYHVKKHINN